jgi:hypothetical protein
MTALVDIQQALNWIRHAEREQAAAERLAVLALLNSTAADIARDLRGSQQTLKKRAGTKSPSAAKPKPLPVPQPPRPAPQPDAKVKTKPRPFTEPPQAADNY